MSEDTPWLVVGLGNPGSRYAAHRHNVGQMVIAHLGSQVGGSFSLHRGVASVLTGRLGAPGGSGTPAAPGVSGTPAARGQLPPRVVLAAPTSFMNVSGPPVASLLKYYDIPADRLMVVHDELDLPFATTRLKSGGGEGGHNGLRSISASIGTRDYVRVRVGVCRPPGRMDPADFVLQAFSTVESKELPFLIDEAGDAVIDVLCRGLLAAQQRLHAG